MPELPEVETVRRGLEPVLVGARLAAVEARRPDLRAPLPANFVRRLTGRRVESLGRRAKYLVADLDDGTVLVMHLGMSGSFRVEHGAGSTTTPGRFHHPPGRNGAHDHVVFSTDRGAVVTYNDPRRFGLMTLVPRRDLDGHPLFRDHGIEPLGNELDGAVLARLLAGKKTSLKAALLDQRLVAGLGNIYVCEALFRARRSRMRTFLRKVEEAIATGDQAAAAEALRVAQPEIMRAAQKHVLHKNTASRKVSRLAQRVKALA
jgi:formamidopyrimidine-DNA glycosylase